MSRFLTCLPFILAQECPYPQDWSNPKNFSNDRRDKGGPTMCGIIQREYDHYCKTSGLPTRPVRLCSQIEGYTIYRMWYWDPHCDSIPAGLDLSFFNSAVNEGSTEAIEILQAALGVSKDGIWGPLTAAAVARASSAAAVEAFTTRQFVVYKEIVAANPRDAVFAPDWHRRSQEIEAEALKMVTP